jgi:hypothetical protein
MRLRKTTKISTKIANLNILSDEFLPEKLPGLEHPGNIVEGAESLLPGTLLGSLLLIV